MKKFTRRTLSLVLTLVLICALAVVAFADTLMATASENYSYENIIMTHKIVGYDVQVQAVISFSYTNGDPVSDNFTFSYDGYIDYQYCPEDMVRPDYYVAGRKTDAGSAIGAAKYIYTNYLTNGYAMIDASMRFTTQFNTEHATIYHNRPDTIYIGIY